MKVLIWITIFYLHTFLGAENYGTGDIVLQVGRGGKAGRFFE
jgi:hypothetical protein